MCSLATPLIESATLFTTFEESLCYRSSVRQVVPPDKSCIWVVQRWNKTTRYVHTCHILPPSEIDLGLCWADFTDLEGNYLFHRIGWKGRICCNIETKQHDMLQGLLSFMGDLPQGHSCHILPFQPILWNRCFPPEPVKATRNSPQSISEGGRIWQVWRRPAGRTMCLAYSIV